MELYVGVEAGAVSVAGVDEPKTLHSAKRRHGASLVDHVLHSHRHSLQHIVLAIHHELAIEE